MLGTLAFCALIPAFVSTLDFKRIKQLFPPIVIGPVIMLIGIALIGVGFGDWGGGTFCAQRVIYNGFSNNLMSAVVTNDGDYGFSSTDGVSSGQNTHPTGGHYGAGNGMHTVQIPLASFSALSGNLTNNGAQIYDLSALNLTALSSNCYNPSTPCVTFKVSNLAADDPATRGTTTIGSSTIYSKSGTGLQFMNFGCGESGEVRLRREWPPAHRLPSEPSRALVRFCLFFLWCFFF